MSKVKLSPKFQVVIPQGIREKLDLKPGESIIVVEIGGVIHLIRQKPIKEMLGFVKGGDMENIRDEEDRF